MAALTQSDADRILHAEKRFVSPGSTVVLAAGRREQHRLQLVNNGAIIVMLYLSRSAKNVNKASFHVRLERPAVDLCRLDIGGPPHLNPDRSLVECPHLHWYREGAGLAWSEPFPTVDKVSIREALSTFLGKINVVDELTFQPELLAEGSGL